MKRTSWNKGIPRTDAEKLKISIGRKEAIRKYGHPRGMLGKKHTQETIRKISNWKPTQEQKEKQIIQTRLSAQKRSKKILIKCIICGKYFLVQKKREKTVKYCSYTCLGASKIRKRNKCPNCGKRLERKETKFCLKCNGLNKRGSNCYLWKGGVSPINKIVRMRFEMVEWRKKVFERDNWTCQECNERGKKLQAHHIKSFSQYPELRFAINNGRTLCINCHKKTDTYLKHKGNPKQST